MGRVKGYRQFCPLARAAEIVAERWTPLLIRELLDGSHRFNELRRSVPLMSPSLMTRRLRTLEDAGVVERRDDGYYLTAAGESLRGVVDALDGWGRQWLTDHLDDGPIDAGALLWNLRRRIAPERLADDRAVITFDLGVDDSGPRRWWLVIERGSADLVSRDPGLSPDLRVETDARSLARVWLGELSFDAAEGDGLLRLEGRAKARRLLARCLAPTNSGRAGRSGSPAREE